MKKITLLILFLLVSCVPLAQQALPTAMPDGYISGFQSCDVCTFYIDGSNRFTNHNANRAWSIQKLDDYTLRLELRGGDKWSGDSSESQRTEFVRIDNQFPVNTSLRVDFQFMIEPGTSNTANWLLIFQLHPKSNILSPYMALEMQGERMMVVMRNNSIDYRQLWIDRSNVVRGQWYQMRVETNDDTSSNGYLRVWRDGVQVVNYSGAIGYGDTTKVSFDIYRANASSIYAVQFRKILINKNNVIPSTNTPTASLTATRTATMTPTATATATTTPSLTQIPSMTAINSPTMTSTPSLPMVVEISYRGIGKVLNIRSQKTIFSNVVGNLNPYVEVEILEIYYVTETIQGVEWENIYGKLGENLYIPLLYRGVYYTSWR